MDRDQAAKIQRNALEAADAIGKIEQIGLELSKEERLLFAEYLGDIVTALHFGILQEVYARYPELREGYEEPPTVSSFLKWPDVILPDSITAEDLDSAILSVLHRNWLKTARIITDTAAACKDRSVAVDFEVIAARLQVLANEGRIESKGNLSMWRHSEVRLPPSC